MSANDFPYVLSRYVDNYKRKFAEQVGVDITALYELYN